MPTGNEKTEPVCKGISQELYLQWQEEISAIATQLQVVRFPTSCKTHDAGLNGQCCDPALRGGSILPPLADSPPEC